MPAMILGLLAGMSVTLIIYALRLKSAREKSHKCACFSPGTSWTPPFEASAYLERMESVHLSIQETAQPVDWTITLWLGLDGLRIDPDGTSEWIKRSGPAPQHRAVGGFGAVWEPTPPLSSVSVLYADDKIIEMEASIDPTMAIQAQLDKLRTENAVMSMRQQIQQTCVTPPIYTGGFPYPQTCMTPPLYPGFIPYPQYKI